MDSELIARILSPILIGIVIFIVVCLILKSNKKVDTNCLNQTSIIVYLPKAYFWIGLVDSAVFLIFIILAIYINSETAPVWVFVLFSAFLLLGIFLLLETLMWKITVHKDKDYFEYTALFFRKKQIYYKDCTNYCFASNSLVIYAGRKRIFVDIFCTNYEAIYSMLISNKIKEKCQKSFFGKFKK